MKPNSVSISAPDAETACTEGAKELGLEPDQVTVELSGESTYVVAPKSAPGRLEIAVSEDEMTARIETIAPPVGDGEAVTFADVEAALAERMVTFGIDKSAVEKVIAEVAATGEARGSVVVAVGEQPVPTQDASIALQFQLNGQDPKVVAAERGQDGFIEEAVVKELVTEGDVLAVKTPLQPAVTGFSVTGTELPGREPSDQQLEIDESVELVADGLRYVVAEGVTGYANFIDGTLCVEDPICVSEDALSVSLCTQPPAASGKRITVEGVAAILEARGVTRGIDSEAIERAVAQAVQTGMPVCTPSIASGRDQQRGHNARIELKFQSRAKSGTTIEGTDRIDYRERGVLQNVNTGDLIAVKTPATAGSEGFDVFGNTIPAVPGDDKELAIIESVAVSEDGLQYTATIEGVVRLAGDGRVGVSQFYEVSGDVDYSTGNLTMDGTLSVKGWIRAGFTVRPSGDLSVGAGIEDAVVEAGGDIEVHGGIIGDEISRIHAGGDIRARFVENAHLDAGGDIIIEDSIMHSVVSAGGRVTVTEGKGRILGGSVSAGNGIEVNELGSEARTRTAVTVATNTRLLAQIASIQKELSLYRRNKKKLELSLALLARKAKKTNLLPPEAGQLSKLAKFRRAAAVKEAKLSEYKKALVQAVEDEKERAVIHVEKEVFEGTVVTVFGHRLLVREDIPEGGRFVLDTEGLAVKYIV